MQIKKTSKAHQVDVDYLGKCLSAFLQEMLPDIQAHFKGGEFDKTIFGEPLSAFGDNDFQRNHALRRKMAELAADPDTKPVRRARQAVWYVEKWGGIAARSRKVPKIRAHRRKLAGFAYSDPAILIAKGTKGIASWSKVLAYRCYDDCFVYDARVVGCLNAIQVTHGHGIRHRFSSLATDGAPAEAFHHVLKDTGNIAPCIPTKQTYELYCGLLLNQWQTLPAELKAQAIDWQGLEMTLFHHSPAMFERASRKLHRLRFYKRMVKEISAEKRRKRKEYDEKQKEATRG